MKRLTKQQQQRWSAARALFIALMQRAASLDQAELMFDGTPIRADQIEITETEINVQVDRCTYNQFIADPDQDAGLYTRQADYEREMRARFSIIKRVGW